MNNIISYFSNMLLSKSGSIFVGYVALFVVIWFGGRFFGLDINFRIFLLIILTLIILLYYIINWYLLNRRSKGFSNAIELQNNSLGVSSSDLETLKLKMEEAIKTLKTSELGMSLHGNNALYALPWYMLIGPSAAGKSTLLRNSGLHFPYAHSDDYDIKGFGGTHNCDWWFSDEAVILDTAGRYTTSEKDNKEWVEFLSLLKKYRKKMPINGIVIAISLSDILISDVDSIDQHIRSIRERINELTKYLGFVFPLYIVFTKCDLLNGFSSFFSNLNENEINQVWGSSVEFNENNNATQIIESKFKELYNRLCDMRIKKLSQHRNIQFKAEAYDFPSQFLAASERLIDFINLLFKDNPYQENPNFKGVYFCSGTQEGQPLQRLIGNLKVAFGKVDSRASSSQNKEQSFFIKSLLSDVIFKSSVDAFVNYRNKRIKKWVKTSVILVSVISMGLSVLILSASYTASRININKGITAVNNISKNDLSNSETYVDSYMKLVELYNHRNKLIKMNRTNSWLDFTGLYRGNLQVNQLEVTIVRIMENIFLIPLGREIESRLMRYSDNWNKLKEDQDRVNIYSEYYNTLKLHLLLSNPVRINLKEILPSLAVYWNSFLLTRNKISETELNSSKIMLPSLIEMYVQQMNLPNNSVMLASHWMENKNIIDIARSDLKPSKNPKALYSQFINKSKLHFKTVSINEMMSSRGSDYFLSKNKISMVFSNDAWKTYVNKELKDISKKAMIGDWVLNIEPITSDNKISSEVSLLKELRALYFSDYSRVWYDFMRSVRIKNSYSITESSNKLSLLSRYDGPYAEFFSILDANINLYEVVRSGSSLASNSKVSLLTENGLNKGNNVSSKIYPLSVKELDEIFKDLRSFTSRGAKDIINENLKKYLKTLNSLYNELDHLQSATDRDRESERISSRILSGEGKSTTLYKAWISTKNVISGSQVKNRSILEPLLISPIKDSWRAILSSATNEIEVKWSSLVVSEFDDRIRGRFPFTGNGPDATLDDVSEFFRPKDGVLWRYLDLNMKPYLAKRKGSWVEKRWLGLGPGFSKHFINALTSSKRISNSLFKRGSDEPTLTFHLYPVPTIGLSEIVLETNGQVYRYRNEPQEWRKFVWPGSVNSSGAKIIGISEKNNIRVEYESHGVWGLFHLLSKARIVKQRGIQYLSTWNMKTYKGDLIKVKFKIRADRRNNILKSNMFKRLYLPNRVTKNNGRKYGNV